MKLFEILIPTIDNSQKKIPLAIHLLWDKIVTKQIGGLTLTKRSYKGKWRGNTEKMIPVRIACEPNDLNEILIFTAAHYRQETVMAYEISSNVWIYNK